MPRKRARECSTRQMSSVKTTSSSASSTPLTCSSIRPDLASPYAPSTISSGGRVALHVSTRSLTRLRAYFFVVPGPHRADMALGATTPMELPVDGNAGYDIDKLIRVCGRLCGVGCRADQRPWPHGLPRRLAAIQKENLGGVRRMARLSQLARELRPGLSAPAPNRICRSRVTSHRFLSNSTQAIYVSQVALLSACPDADQSSSEADGCSTGDKGHISYLLAKRKVQGSFLRRRRRHG
jgi:hypothetical protein